MRIAYVDGYKIHQTLDTDFGAIHSHSVIPTQYSPKFYIPEGEIWIDHRYKKETEFLLKEEEWYRSILKNYHQERRRRILAMRLEGPAPDFIISKTRQRGLNVIHVDGAIVRQHLDFEFVSGGHDLVYDYIPAKTVWLDASMDTRDIPHVLLHEMKERELMAQGKSYEVAHEFATAYEREARRQAGGIYQGDPGYPLGLSHDQFIKKYVKKYETHQGQTLPSTPQLLRTRVAKNPAVVLRSGTKRSATGETFGLRQ